MTDLPGSLHAAPVPMGVAVYGLPRSGTTLISDLLTVPGHALVISEPDIYKAWNRNIARRVHALAGSVGLELPGGVPEPGDWHGSYAEFVRHELAPRLARFDLWGIKCVDFSDWRRLFAEFPPAKLVLCLRDLRDLVLSGIDRISRMPLVFRSSGTRRDEAWVLSALAYNGWELLAMRSEPHFAIRYEDVARDPAILEALARYVGLERLDPTRNNLAAAGWHRRWEIEKHGDGITAASVGRFAREPAGPIRSLAERLWRLMPEYGEAFGYELPGPAGRIAAHAFRPGAAEGNPIRFLDTERSDWRGPPGIEPAFARRRARRLAARNLAGARRVLDLGGGSRALASLLPQDAVHILADNVARADDLRVADIYGGELPRMDDADIVVALDVLEYVEDLPRFLGALHAAGRPALVSYHTSDDAADVDRAGLGWRNDFDRTGLMAAFETAGFSVTARWAFDGAQSLFRLRPG
jgi:hypothetical protein